MAKLHLFHSVMNAGKTTHLLQARYNYMQNGGRVLLFTSAIDDRTGIGKVSSRIGLEADAHPLTATDDLYLIVEREHRKAPVAAVLLDEINFMTPAHASQASDIADYLDIPVMAYGLKNNSQGSLFGEGVQKFLALAQDIKELKTTCHCNKRKATMILRYGKNGRVIRDGAVIQTGGEESYVSVCSTHYKEGDIGPLARKKVRERGEEVLVFCTHCNESYGPATMDWDQANDCASYVRGNKVTGAYGSGVTDMSTFHFTNGRPANVQNGVICDKCVQSFIDQDILHEVI